MNTTIIKKDFLQSDEFIELHLDTKSMYLYILCCPDKGYLNVYKFNKRLASLITGMSNNSIESGLNELINEGYIDLFGGYIGLLKSHVADVGGQWGAKNRERELEAMPVDVRSHFGLDSEGVMTVERAKKDKKRGPAPETIADIIEKQNPKIQEALRDFVADRVERKRPPTTRAVKGWIAKLHTMYPNNHDKQALSLYQSIERGWMGLFEVKEERNEADRKFL